MSDEKVFVSILMHVNITVIKRKKNTLEPE